MSKPYAEVIGDPVIQSKSPLIHNFWLGRLEIDAEYRAAHVRPEQLADYLARRRNDTDWRGCNVTMPHKQAVMPLLDELAPGREDHVVDLAHFAGATDFAFDDREGIIDLIVNASPLGMTGHPPLELDFSHAPPGSTVYDIVTHPVDTPLLVEARRLGFETVDGLAMLVGQASAAFEQFFGAPAPRQHDAELRALLAV